MNKITVYFIPFAGGNRFSFREYVRSSPAPLNFIPLEYPGRGMRINEPLLTDTRAIVDDLYERIKHEVEGKRYALFGHSMGALIAFLLARKLRNCGRDLPVHVFLTGTSGPSALSREQKQRHLLDKDEFIAAVKEMGGLPDEILENEEMLEYFEPILRADFAAVETYRYVEEPPLKIRFTIVTGTEEDMSDEDIDLWRKESGDPVKFHKLPGGHFFVLNYVAEMQALITRELLPIKKLSNYER